MDASYNGQHAELIEQVLRTLEESQHMHERVSVLIQQWSHRQERRLPVQSFYNHRPRTGYFRHGR